VNAAREDGGTVLAAGAAPPAQLALREDLRSRLGWGLVYEVKPLTDAERALYLRAEAARRGLRLADEVVWYLLSHVRRDMPSLRALLEQLDRASLEQHRPVTLPLVREALKAFER
jgi:DnaA family protein